MLHPESRWDSNFRLTGIAVVWLVTAVMLIGAAVLDAAGQGGLLVVVLAAPVAFLLLLIGGLLRAGRHVLAAFAVLGVWFAVLPFIRWGPLKGFYMDCARIEAGMSVARASKIMTPYLLTERPARLERELAGARQATELSGPPPDAEPDRILFIPDLENRADWCIVYTSGEVVRNITLAPD